LRAFINLIDDLLDCLPLDPFVLLEILYLHLSMTVFFLPTFQAIEQLFFVWAFLFLADVFSFFFTADAAILEKLNLLRGQLDCFRHLLYINETKKYIYF
jgi:hypothetical protein